MRILLPSAVRLAFGDGFIWISNPAEQSISRIEATTGQFTGSPLALDREPREIAHGEGAVWVCSADRSRLIRIDPKTNEMAAEIDPQTNEIRAREPIDFVGANLVAGGGSVWVAPAARDSGQPTGNDGIARIDERTSRIVETIHVGEAATSDYYSVYFSEGSLWVLIEGPQTSLAPISMP